MNKRKLWYYIDGIWLPISAQLIGLHHLIRGHHTVWFKDPDLWNAHLGWVYCYRCADTTDQDGVNDLVIWGFYLHRVHRLLQKLCGWLGHKEAKEVLTCAKDQEDNDWNTPTGRFYCSRCIADVSSPKDYHALTTCNPYRPCSCGVSSDDPQATNPERHNKDCAYRN